VRIFTERSFVITFGFFNQPADSLELVKNLGSLLANREAVSGACFKLTE
jgi:hypothetical protein